MKGIILQEMRKFLPILLIAVFLISLITVLTACGSNPEQPQVSSPPPETENTPPPVGNDVNREPQGPGGNDPGNSPGNNPGSDELNPTPPPLPDVFFFSLGNYVIDMNENISYVIERLGEPLGIMVLPSCAFDGDDRIYRYPGAELYTYPIGEEDFIHTVSFYDDTIRTAEGGIRLGSRLQAVLDAYGGNYEFDAGMYKFIRGKTSLEFLISDEMVIGITYRYIIDDMAWN